MKKAKRHGQDRSCIIKTVLNFTDYLVVQTVLRSKQSIQITWYTGNVIANQVPVLLCNLPAISGI